MLQQMLATIRAGIRSHSFKAIIILALALIVASHAAGALSGRHQQTVGLDVGLSGIRLALTLLLLFWQQELVGREIDKKTVFFVLTYPLPRSFYLLGRYAGIACLLLLATVFMGLALAVATHFGYGDGDRLVRLGVPYWLTLFFVWLDMLVVVSFGCMLGSFASSSLIPFVLTLAFAFGARSIGLVLAFLAAPGSEGADIAPQFMPILDAIGWVLPDLSRLDVRISTLYNIPFDWHMLSQTSLMMVAYIGTMLGLACLFFNKREFE